MCGVLLSIYVYGITAYENSHQRARRPFHHSKVHSVEVYDCVTNKRSIKPFLRSYESREILGVPRTCREMSVISDGPNTRRAVVASAAVPTEGVLARAGHSRTAFRLLYAFSAIRTPLHLGGVLEHPS